MRLPLIPASFFSMVLGIAGLGGSWRLASRVWGMPSFIGETLMGIGCALWVVLTVLYVAKWIWARSVALEEARHPIQCCFIGVGGVATLLVASAVLPYSRAAGEVFAGIGAIATIGFAVWRTGSLWQGGRDAGSTTAVLYLPTVGGAFVGSSLLAAMGLHEWGQLSFGAGLFSWLGIESVVLVRLYTASPLPQALRPTLGIQLAPPSVGLVALLAVSDSPLGLPVNALLGYALFQAAVLLRLLPWVREQAFIPAYWGYSFGLSAMAAAPLAMVLHGDHSIGTALAPVTFVGSNLLVAALTVATILLLLRGSLLPASATNSQSSVAEPVNPAR